MKRAVEILRAVSDWMLRFPLGRSQWVVIILWSLVLAGGMIQFGDRIALATNVDSELYDQGAYLRVAEQNRGAWWPTVTDGIRNPLFPWLVAKTSDPGTEAMFNRGLKLNVRLGAILVFAFGIWAGRRLAWLPGMIFVTIAAAVVLPISTYVGTEVLFYGLFFAAWMLALALVGRLTFLNCALFGGVLGFAYLAKPGVTLLTGCFVIVGLVLWLRSKRKDEGDGWNGIRPLGGAAIALTIFTLMILPRALNAWAQFRDPLQNTATRCFWARDWEECYPILGHLNPRFIERIPADNRPSASRFFKLYGWSGISNRISNGMAVQADNLFAPDPKSIWFDRKPSAKRPVRRIFPYRGFFLLPPVALAIGLFAATRRTSEANGSNNAAPRYQLAFGILLVALSFGAFSWYSVIAPGARFLMALYLPVLGSLLLVVESLRRQLARRWCDYVVGGTWLLIFTIVTSHLALIATHPYFDKLKGAF